MFALNSCLRLNSFKVAKKKLYRIQNLSTLTIIEHYSGKISNSSLNTLTAVKELGGEITTLIAGSKAKEVASQVSKIPGISKVLIACSSAYDHCLPENLAELITSNSEGITHIVAPGSSFGKNFLPRVSALLDSSQISDIIKIEDENTFIRPIYAGNVIQTVRSLEKIKLLLIRTSSFPPAEIGNSSATIMEAKDPKSPLLSEWVSEELNKSERPDLSGAKRVVSGGRGLKNKDNFDKIITPLADSLQAAIGASRAAVDSGFVDNSLQVGQTGKVVAPELYIAVGISGAIQHLAGMKDSKLIVAINKDPDAPIFEVADLGIVGDLFSIVPILTEKIKSL